MAQSQALLLNQVITKIRQSLDLQDILATTVAEVRRFLATDRLLIYQFADPAPYANAQQQADLGTGPSPNVSGYITYESIGSDQWTSVLGFNETHCFDRDTDHWRKYLKGEPIAIENVSAAYANTPCLKRLLQQAAVKAQIIAPIVIHGTVWGLLIAHQCDLPRQWQSQELLFLRHIAEHLGVAIQQAQLYEQLQVQTNSLESCVVDRTQELRDALVSA